MVPKRNGSEVMFLCFTASYKLCYRKSMLNLPNLRRFCFVKNSNLLDVYRQVSKIVHYWFCQFNMHLRLQFLQNSISNMEATVNKFAWKLLGVTCKGRNFKLTGCVEIVSICVVQSQHFCYYFLLLIWSQALKLNSSSPNIIWISYQKRLQDSIPKKTVWWYRVWKFVSIFYSSNFYVFRATELSV